MNKTALLMMFLILSIMLLGCSSNKTNRGYGQGRGLNLTEEERQQMFEQMQQKAIEACQDKTEGDSCTFESPRGDVNGVCKIVDENLVCITDRPMRQR